MSSNGWKQKCAHFRAIPLETVLRGLGAKQDNDDIKKWHTIRGPISITGAKFFNWQCGYGGGGAIDLVMHLDKSDFSSAIAYLSKMSPWQLVHNKQHSLQLKTMPLHQEKSLILPHRDNYCLPRIISYLINQRKLPSKLIYKTIESDNIYANTSANAVFLMHGRRKSIIGAEIRGTTRKKWRGLAPGSDKGKGAFVTGSSSNKRLVLCESAIDALSYVSLYPQTRAVSTAGATPHLRWIDNFIKEGFELICAFDNDDTGNKTADKMIQIFPTIKRHKPQAHDWNDVLRAKIL